MSNETDNLKPLSTKIVNKISGLVDDVDIDLDKPLPDEVDDKPLPSGRPDTPPPPPVKPVA